MTTWDKLQRYPDDIALFLEEQYVLPETGKRIIIEPWQRKHILEPLFYDLDEDGRRQYDIALISMPKKNGKSALAAGVALHALFAGEPLGQVIIAANDKDQASMIVYSKVREAIQANSRLKGGTHAMKGSIEIKSTGTRCWCIAHQYESAAGLNPNLTIFDEIWGFPNRKFYDELTTVPTRRNPLTVIVTYAGYDESGLLWDLYCDGMAGETVMEVPGQEVYIKRGREDRRMLMFWSHENLASWVTDEYLANQQRRLPPNVYARLHENRWIGASGDFITQADIDGMHAVPWVMQCDADKEAPYRYIVAIDLGLSHDRTARAVGHYNPRDNRVYVDNLRVWEGSADEHVSIQSVEQDLVECAERFKSSAGYPILVVDPWQMEYVIQRLKGAYHIKEFNFNTDMIGLSQLLVGMIRSGRVVTYDMPVLDAELRNMVSKQTSRGWRIDHAGKQRNDCAIAVGMMLTEAIRETFGGADLPDIMSYGESPPHFAGIRGRAF